MKGALKLIALKDEERRRCCFYPWTAGGWPTRPNQWGPPRAPSSGAAWPMARAVASLVGRQEGEAITNVEDPVLVLKSALAPRASAVARPLLPWCVHGAPLCRKKGRHGKSATLVGAFLLAYPSGTCSGCAGSLSGAPQGAAHGQQEWCRSYAPSSAVSGQCSAGRPAVGSRARSTMSPFGSPP